MTIIILYITYNHVGKTNMTYNLLTYTCKYQYAFIIQLQIHIHNSVHYDIEYWIEC